MAIKLLEGKVAAITGALTGIGRVCLDTLIDTLSSTSSVTLSRLIHMYILVIDHGSDF